MSIITLTTDYGLKDHYAGSIHGKILTEYPEATIVNISHTIDPFNIAEASYILNAAYKNFPKGSVHIIGVDIEKNYENKHIVMLFDDHFFVCADNGILSLLSFNKTIQRIITIDIHEHLINNATDIDVFVKVACHLAKAGKLNDVGKETVKIKEITELQPTITDISVKGNIIYIDHYGNVVTNITKKIFEKAAKNRAFKIVLFQTKSYNNPKNITKIYSKYSESINSDFKKIKDSEGDQIAIFNEQGFLEIAIFRSNPNGIGSAKSLLGLSYRDVISVEFL